jgi:hypothetical protein
MSSGCVLGIAKMVIAGLTNHVEDLDRSSVTHGTEPSAPVGSDQAQLSALAQSLAASDSGRLEQLRLEVQSGSYDPPATAVANALIEAHLNH